MENKFTQLCVWQGVVLEGSTPKEFEDFFKDTFDARIKYETEISTLPDLDNNGNPVPETGNRNDVFFYIHTDDVMLFAIHKLTLGIRWWEDVVGYNDGSYLYPKEFVDKYPLTW
jgi:hypothetical protein